MSFYIKEVVDISKRYPGLLAVRSMDDAHPASMVYEMKCGLVETKERGYNYPVFMIRTLIKEITGILEFVKTKNLPSVELLVEEEDEADFEGIVNIISSFLLENEASVGLLVKNSEIIENHRVLLENNNVYICKSVSVGEGEADDLGRFAKANFKAEIPTKKENKPSNDFSFNSSCNKYYLSFITTGQRQPSFAEKLNHFIERSGKTPSEIYEAAGISKQVFSKCRLGENHNPKKDTILCLIMGLELKIDEAEELLDSAGFSLSRSIETDLIVRAFINKGNYNTIELNEELDAAGEPPIGWTPRE